MQDLNYTCATCDYRISAEGLCRKCHAKFHRMLDDLYELWSDAHLELLPGRGGHGSHSSEQTIGLNVAALSFIAGDDILKTLHEWERLIRAERQLTPPAYLRFKDLPSEITDAIKFQQDHLAWASTQDWFDDFVKELRALHGQGMAAARRFVERVRRIPCPADDAEGLPCDNLLIVRDDDLLDIFTCRRCGAEWNAIRLMAVALSNPASRFWVDAEAIAKWLGITERRVRQIAKEHDVAKRGELYDFKAIIQARTEVG